MSDTCRYCKQPGHIIKDCPTRPPRSNNRGRGRGRGGYRQAPRRERTPPASPEKLPSEMYWPSLISQPEEGKKVPIQGVWASGSILDAIKESQSDSE